MNDTQKEALKRLAETNDLVKDDFFKDPRGFVIITRTGIEKLQAKNKIQVSYEVIACNKDHYVIKATGLKQEGMTIETFASATPENCKSKFLAEVCEKRALARVVLKIMNLYEYGVFSEDEIEKE